MLIPMIGYIIASEMAFLPKKGIRIFANMSRMQDAYNICVRPTLSDILPKGIERPTKNAVLRAIIIPRTVDGMLKTVL